MGEPLVLYKADDIDAADGARQVKERWPGAEVREVSRSPAPKEAAETFPDELWLLGLSPPGIWAGGWHAIDPTPDASVASQVWRLLNPGNSTEWDNPPWHVLYIDDAVCERWELHLSLEWWAWACSHKPERVVSYIREEPKSATAIPPMWMISEGVAILRDRSRRDAEDAGMDEALEFERAEVKRLRAEVLDMHTAGGVTWVNRKCFEKKKAERDEARARADRYIETMHDQSAKLDEAKAGLRKALRLWKKQAPMPVTGHRETRKLYAVLCDLAGVEP